MAVPLDTLQIVKRLKEAGFGDPQAEALTTVFRDLRGSDLSYLATKADIERLETDIERVEGNIERVEAKLSTFVTKSDLERLEAKLAMFATKTDLDRLEAKLDVKNAEMKVEIIRWVFGIAFAQAALILAVLKLFPSGHP